MFGRMVYIYPKKKKKNKTQQLEIHMLFSHSQQVGTEKENK